MIKEMQRQFYLNYIRYSSRYELLAPNVFPDWYFKEMDLMGIRHSGYVDEIEIKLSRSDFLADFKKTVNIRCERYFDEMRQCNMDWKVKAKHKALAEGLNHCNYFSFLMPSELAEKCEIPEYAGLYTFDGQFLKEVKKPPKLHRRKISESMKYNIARKLAYRFWENME